MKRNRVLKYGAVKIFLNKDRWNEVKAGKVYTYTAIRSPDSVAGWYPNHYIRIVDGPQNDERARAYLAGGRPGMGTIC